MADIIGTGLGFTLYDSFVGWYRRVVGGRKPTPAEKGALGGASACVCLTVTQPLEVVMTRMRVQGVGGRPVLYKNAVDCLRVIARREGMRSLWLGLGAAYGKIFPQLAITYCVFEMVNERMGVDGLARYDGGNTHGKGGRGGRRRHRRCSGGVKQMRFARRRRSARRVGGSGAREKRTRCVALPSETSQHLVASSARRRWCGSRTGISWRNFGGTTRAWTIR